MSKEQARMLRFVIKYPGWIGFRNDVKRVVESLARHGLLEVSWETNQFRLKQEE